MIDENDACSTFTFLHIKIPNIQNIFLFRLKQVECYKIYEYYLCVMLK